MAENQEYEAVVAMEDDENSVVVRSTGKGSEQEIVRNPQEDIELVRVHKEKENDDNQEQKYLLGIVEFASYNSLKERLTAKVLLESRGNTLLLAIKVIEILHERAGKQSDIDPRHFIDLADRVEEFTLRFLDPLKYEPPYIRKAFASHQETDVILDTAIKLQQKKFFDHPIITEIMNLRWYSGIDISEFWLRICTIWCLFDVVLLPLAFFLAFLLGFKKNSCLPLFYQHFFEIPYLVFVRDAISYVALLGLHFGICVEPLQLSFTGLEWAILVFLFGRLLLEFTQIAEIASAEGRKMKLKVFGNYLSVCNKTGITCWLEVTVQLGLSLLELSDGLDFFKSTNLVSQTLSRILFAAYLIVALVLLINMLIALLSNTYQRVQDNSRKEWAFQKAVTVQTYHNLHPIPVPFNIISIPLMVLPCLRRKTQKLRYVDVSGTLRFWPWKPMLFAYFPLH